MRLRNIIMLLLLGCMPSLVYAEAEQSFRFDSVTVYTGKGIEQDLMESPANFVGNTLTLENTYYLALQYTKLLNEVGYLQHRRMDYSHEFEVNILQHFGLQHNQELAIAYTARTPDLHLKFVNVNFAMGMGFSQAFGTPSYEDGPDFDPSRRYHFQFFFPLEFEWSSPEGLPFSVVTRVHHRSGIAGMVAPLHVGSNFFALGLRYVF